MMVHKPQTMHTVEFQRERKRGVKQNEKNKEATKKIV